MVFALDPQTAKAIVEHARREYPNECCGLLAGARGRAEKLFPLANAASRPDFYELDPREQFESFREIEGRDWELVAIYHSHPRSEAFPSKTDVELAFYPDSHYLICSLRDTERPVIRAFRIKCGVIEEEEISMGESGQVGSEMEAGN
ncbi:MAG: M67 family metallopeptidase [Actinomycetota bacterium]